MLFSNTEFLTPRLWNNGTAKTRGRVCAETHGNRRSEAHFFTIAPIFCTSDATESIIPAIM
jgi:hypothetical protein